MDNLNLSDTEQRVQGFQSRIRVDYAAKIHEVAKLTDEVAKLQTQLLDVEYENNVLRQQLVLARSEIVELKKGTPSLTTSGEGKSSRAVTTASEILKLSSKRGRSPSFEIVDMPKRSSKKLKGKERAEHSMSVNSTADRQVVASVVHASRLLQGTQVLSVKAEAILVNTSSHHHSEPTNTTQFPDSSRRQHNKNLTANEDEVSRSDSDSHSSDDDNTNLADKSNEEMDVGHASLPKSATDRYLESAEPLDIYPSPLDLEVDRSFLQASYGGAISRNFLTYIPPKQNPSGPVRRRVIFSTMVVNPSMPSRPGAPGLIFASRYQILPHLSCTLFSQQKKNKWRYLGEYEGEWVGNMSAEIFRMQSPKFQHLWAQRVLKQKQFDEYLAMRARISLRLASVIPMDDKDEEERVVLQEVDLIKKNGGRPVSEDDIITAFFDGDEEIDVIRVKCIEYDHVFANDMKARFVKSIQEIDQSD